MSGMQKYELVASWMGIRDCVVLVYFVFFFQAEDGIRDLVRSRGLGDVYKRQVVEELRLVGLGKFRCDRPERIVDLVETHLDAGDLSLIHI